MRGYTQEQLEARGLNVSNYVGCLNCRRHWHRRVFDRHFNAPSPTPAAEEIEIIHPAWANFLDFLAESAVKKWFADEEDRRRRGEPLETSLVSPDPVPPKKTQSKCLTVDEAVQQLGLSRDEIMAEFEKNAVPFEVHIPRPPNRRGKRPSKTLSTR